MRAKVAVFILALISVLWPTASTSQTSGGGAWDIVPDGTYVTVSPLCSISGATQAGGSASMSGAVATFTASSGTWGPSFVVNSTFVASGWTPSGYNATWFITGGGFGSTTLTATSQGTSGLGNSTAAGNLQSSCTIQYNVQVTWNASDGQNAILKFSGNIGVPRVLNVTGLTTNTSMGGHYFLKITQDSSTGGTAWILGSGCNWQFPGAGSSSHRGYQSGSNLAPSAFSLLEFLYDGMGNCLVLSQ